MKNLILLAALFSVPVMAENSTSYPGSGGVISNHPVNFSSGELMQNIPNIIRSIPGMEQTIVTGTPAININGKSLSSFTDESINSISSASINRFDYMQPSSDYPNGVLLIYVDGI